jgi:integrase/recombinase XerD
MVPFGDIAWDCKTTYSDLYGSPQGSDLATGSASYPLRQRNTPAELRACALFLLFSIYGLRSSEVAGLRLEDFDWRNETFTVRRAKRGGIQQYPIQYEVGEAILKYLQHGRPQSSCRHVFLIREPCKPI